MILPARVHSILRGVARSYGVTIEDIVHQGHSPDIVSHAKHCARYILVRRAGWSLNPVGKFTGMAHHSTVLHSVRRVEAAIGSDPESALLLEECISALGVRLTKKKRGWRPPAPQDQQPVAVPVPLGLAPQMRHLA